MCITLYQNSKTIQINSEALELQKKDFRIRNRPIVDATEARFGSSLISAEGYKHPYTVQIALINLTDIPITSLKFFEETFSIFILSILDFQWLIHNFRVLYNKYPV